MKKKETSQKKKYLKIFHVHLKKKEIEKRKKEIKQQRNVNVVSVCA